MIVKCDSEECGVVLGEFKNVTEENRIYSKVYCESCVKKMIAERNQYDRWRTAGQGEKNEHKT